MFGKTFWAFGLFYALVAVAGFVLAVRIAPIRGRRVPAPIFGLFVYALSTLIFLVLALCLGKAGKRQRLGGVIVFSLILGILLIL